ncbi:hypothetical protein EDB80DRAFT_658517 [Ilyonectria destructans]|nr:hypothetical protein EDB80DRAFT_658517 [Ilyonectria destructans]
MDQQKQLQLQQPAAIRASQSWLCYYPHLHILICTSHGYAVADLPRHLRRQHADLSLATRRGLAEHYCEENLNGPSSQQGQDQDREKEAAVAPFAGLPIHHAFRCRKCPSFLTVNWKLCKTHCSQLHAAGSEQARAGLWYQALAQTFFTQPARRFYFPVNPTAAAIASSPSPSSSSSSTTIQQQWEYEQSEQQEKLLQIAEGSIRKHEITNWLRRTGWIDHFSGRDLRPVYLASRMPQPEDDPGLELLVKALDSIFFRGCIAGLQEMPLIGRLFLASPYLEDPHSRPFGPLQEKASMDRYLGYSKRFLCYCMRVLPLGADDLAEQHAFSFTPAQRDRLGGLWSRLQEEAAESSSSSSSSSSSGSSRLEGEVLQVLASFWMQRLPADPFASPLWHFIAVLGIDGETGQLRPAHHFTGILAGLIYTGRAVVAEAAMPSQDRAAMADLPERLAAIRKAWLRLAVVWNKEGTLLYFQGRPLAMETIRQLIASMTADAEDLLWDGLLFRPPHKAGPGQKGALGLRGREDRFLIPLATIQDDLTQTQRGQSFLHTSGLLGKEKEMLQNLIAGPLRKQFLDSRKEWKWPRVQQYLRQVKRFQELLLLLVHLTNHPLRGPEITGLRLINGINRDRSLFVIDGEVVIPRILPGRVGQLMVMYMLYIRPFTDRLQGSRWALHDKVYLPSDFIWHQPESPSTPWDSSQLSRALAKWSQHYAGQRITLQQWRHIAIAIGRRHTRARGAQRANFNEAGEAEAEEEEAEGYEEVEDLAAAHTTRTAAGYGVTIDILKRLTSESLEVFGQASRRWHRFLGCGGAAAGWVEAETAGAAKGQGLEGLAGTEAASLEPEAGQEKKKRRLTASGELPLKAGKRQQEAIQRAAAKQTPLVAILPTGAGKSLVFMVPALLMGAGMTIVVVPFRKLKAQLVSRCREAGLTCSPWPEAQDLWPTVTIISAEAAVSETFLQWAAGLIASNRLDRIVIDECHLSFTAAQTYRERLRRLTLLRGLCCPLVFLTATLPQHRQRDFEAVMLLRSPIYIRASSHRLNLQFKVHKVDNGRDIRTVKELVAARTRTLQPQEKGIIFCCSHASCKAVALGFIGRMLDFKTWCIQGSYGPSFEA